MPLVRTLAALGVAVGLSVATPSVTRLAFDPSLTEVPSSKPVEPLAALIATYAQQYRLDPALLHAVIKVESNFNAQAVSPRGALGLMQLMPLTAAALHVIDPFDPDDNIRAGSALLRRLLDRFDGDLGLALAAYHAGERRVSQSIGMPPIRSTQLYVERVLHHYMSFASEKRLSEPARFLGGGARPQRPDRAHPN